MATEVSQPSTTSKQIEYVSGVTVRLAGTRAMECNWPAHSSPILPP